MSKILSLYILVKNFKTISFKYAKIFCISFILLVPILLSFIETCIISKEPYYRKIRDEVDPRRKNRIDYSLITNVETNKILNNLRIYFHQSDGNIHYRNEINLLYRHIFAPNICKFSVYGNNSVILNKDKSIYLSNRNLLTKRSELYRYKTTGPDILTDKIYQYKDKIYCFYNEIIYVYDTTDYSWENYSNNADIPSLNNILFLDDKIIGWTDISVVYIPISNKSLKDSIYIEITNHNDVIIDIYASYQNDNVNVLLKSGTVKSVNLVSNSISNILTPTSFLGNKISNSRVFNDDLFIFSEGYINRYSSNERKWYSKFVSNEIYEFFINENNILLLQDNKIFAIDLYLRTLTALEKKFYSYIYDENNLFILSDKGIKRVLLSNNGLSLRLKVPFPVNDFKDVDIKNIDEFFFIEKNDLFIIEDKNLFNYNFKNKQYKKISDNITNYIYFNNHLYYIEDTALIKLYSSTYNKVINDNVKKYDIISDKKIILHNNNTIKYDNKTYFESGYEINISDLIFISHDDNIIYLFDKNGYQNINVNNFKKSQYRKFSSEIIHTKIFDEKSFAAITENKIYIFNNGILKKEYEIRNNENITNLSGDYIYLILKHNTKVEWTILDKNGNVNNFMRNILFPFNLNEIETIFTFKRLIYFQLNNGKIYSYDVFNLEGKYLKHVYNSKLINIINTENIIYGISNNRLYDILNKNLIAENVKDFTILNNNDLVILKTDETMIIGEEKYFDLKPKISGSLLRSFSNNNIVYLIYDNGIEILNLEKLNRNIINISVREVSQTDNGFSIISNNNIITYKYTGSSIVEESRTQITNSMNNLVSTGKGFTFESDNRIFYIDENTRNSGLLHNFNLEHISEHKRKSITSVLLKNNILYFFGDNFISLYSLNNMSWTKTINLRNNIDIVRYINNYVYLVSRNVVYQINNNLELIELSGINVPDELKSHENYRNTFTNINENISTIRSIGLNRNLLLIITREKVLTYNSQTRNWQVIFTFNSNHYINSFNEDNDLFLFLNQKIVKFEYRNNTYNIIELEAEYSSYNFGDYIVLKRNRNNGAEYFVYNHSLSKIDEFFIHSINTNQINNIFYINSFLYLIERNRIVVVAENQPPKNHGFKSPEVLYYDNSLFVFDDNILYKMENGVPVILEKNIIDFAPDRNYLSFLFNNNIVKQGNKIYNNYNIKNNIRYFRPVNNSKNIFIVDNRNNIYLYNIETHSIIDESQLNPINKIEHFTDEKTGIDYLVFHHNNNFTVFNLNDFSNRFAPVNIRTQNLQNYEYLIYNNLFYLFRNSIVYVHNIVSGNLSQEHIFRKNYSNRIRNLVDYENELYAIKDDGIYKFNKDNFTFSFYNSNKIRQVFLKKNSFYLLDDMNDIYFDINKRLSKPVLDKTNYYEYATEKYLISKTNKSIYERPTAKSFNYDTLKFYNNFAFMSDNNNFQILHNDLIYNLNDIRAFNISEDYQITKDITVRNATIKYDFGDDNVLTHDVYALLRHKDDKRAIMSLNKSDFTEVIFFDYPGLSEYIIYDEEITYEEFLLVVLEAIYQEPDKTLNIVRNELNIINYKESEFNKFDLFNKNYYEAGEYLFFDNNRIYNTEYNFISNYSDVYIYNNEIYYTNYSTTDKKYFLYKYNRLKNNFNSINDIENRKYVFDKNLNFEHINSIISKNKPSGLFIKIEQNQFISFDDFILKFNKFGIKNENVYLFIENNTFAYNFKIDKYSFNKNLITFSPFSSYYQIQKDKKISVIQSHRMLLPRLINGRFYFDTFKNIAVNPVDKKLYGLTVNGRLFDFELKEYFGTGYDKLISNGKNIYLVRNNNAYLFSNNTIHNIPVNINNIEYEKQIINYNDNGFNVRNVFSNMRNNEFYIYDRQTEFSDIITNNYLIFNYCNDIFTYNNGLVLYNSEIGVYNYLSNFNTERLFNTDLSNLYFYNNNFIFFKSDNRFYDRNNRLVSQPDFLNQHSVNIDVSNSSISIETSNTNNVSVNNNRITNTNFEYIKQVVTNNNNTFIFTNLFLYRFQNNIPRPFYKLENNSYAKSFLDNIIFDMNNNKYLLRQNGEIRNYNNEKISIDVYNRIMELSNYDIRYENEIMRTNQLSLKNKFFGMFNYDKYTYYENNIYFSNKNQLYLIDVNTKRFRLINHDENISEIKNIFNIGLILNSRHYDKNITNYSNITDEEIIVKSGFVDVNYNLRRLNIIPSMNRNFNVYYNNMEMNYSKIICNKIIGITNLDDEIFIFTDNGVFTNYYTNNYMVNNLSEFNRFISSEIKKVNERIYLKTNDNLIYEFTNNKVLSNTERNVYPKPKFNIANNHIQKSVSYNNNEICLTDIPELNTLLPDNFAFGIYKNIFIHNKNIYSFYNNYIFSFKNNEISVYKKQHKIDDIYLFDNKMILQSGNNKFDYSNIYTNVYNSYDDTVEYLISNVNINSSIDVIKDRNANLYIHNIKITDFDMITPVDVLLNKSNRNEYKFYISTEIGIFENEGHLFRNKVSDKHFYFKKRYNNVHSLKIDDSFYKVYDYNLQKSDNIFNKLSINNNIVSQNISNKNIPMTIDDISFDELLSDKKIFEFDEINKHYADKSEIYTLYNNQVWIQNHKKENNIPTLKFTASDTDFHIVNNKLIYFTDFKQIPFHRLSSYKSDIVVNNDFSFEYNFDINNIQPTISNYFDIDTVFYNNRFIFDIVDSLIYTDMQYNQNKWGIFSLKNFVSNIVFDKEQFNNQQYYILKNNSFIFKNENVISYRIDNYEFYDRKWKWELTKNKNLTFKNNFTDNLNRIFKNGYFLDDYILNVIMYENYFVLLTKCSKEILHYLREEKPYDMLKYTDRNFFGENVIHKDDVYSIKSNKYKYQFSINDTFIEVIRQ